MKKANILIITLLAGIFFSCSDNENTYRLSGKIEGGANEKLYLMEMENSGVNALDTIVLDKKGGFSVKETLKEPSIFILQGKNDYIMLCPQKNEKIKITGEYNNLSTSYTIQGSKESGKLKTLSDKQTQTRFTLKMLNDQLAQMDITNIDSVRREVALTYQSIREEQRNFVINYINANEGSLTTLVALYRTMENRPLIDFRNDLDIYKKVLNGLKKTYPDNKNTDNLEKFILHVQQIQTNNSVNNDKK